MIIILNILFAIIQANPISEIRSHTLRFHPNQNIVKELKQYIETNQIKAASISTCVGSLLKCSIRFANQPEFTEINGHFEIVSLVGTISVYEQHIHISLSDTEGKTIGGHLPFYDNECIIYTTAEIVLLEHIETIYTKKLDPTYGYYELYIVEQLELCIYVILYLKYQYKNYLLCQKFQNYSKIINISTLQFEYYFTYKYHFLYYIENKALKLSINKSYFQRSKQKSQHQLIKFLFLNQIYKNEIYNIQGNLTLCKQTFLFLLQLSNIITLYQIFCFNVSYSQAFKFKTSKILKVKNG